MRARHQASPLRPGCCHHRSARHRQCCLALILASLLSSLPPSPFPCSPLSLPPSLLSRLSLSPLLFLFTSLISSSPLSSYSPVPSLFFISALPLFPLLFLFNPNHQRSPECINRILNNKHEFHYAIKNKVHNSGRSLLPPGQKSSQVSCTFFLFLFLFLCHSSIQPKTPKTTGIDHKTKNPRFHYAIDGPTI